jgi:hypothetical protein
VRLATFFFAFGFAFCAQGAEASAITTTGAATKDAAATEARIFDDTVIPRSLMRPFPFLLFQLV